MRKRILALVMIMALVLSLTACGGSSSSGSDTSSSGGTSALYTILSSGKLKVGMLSSEPMCMVDANGNYSGYDYDTAVALAEALGVELEIVEMQAAERISALQTNKVDVVIGAFTVNATRAASVAFSDPYFTCPAKLVLPADSSYSNASDLTEFAGCTIGVTKGSSNKVYLEKMVSDGIDIKIFEGEGQAELKTALQNKQIDSFAMDGSAADYLSLSEPSLYKAGPAISGQFFNSIGVNLEDDVLLQYVNTFVMLKGVSGFFDDLYVKYFGVENEYSLTPQY